jgi:hypothetical protein
MAESSKATELWEGKRPNIRSSDLPTDYLIHQGQIDEESSVPEESKQEIRPLSADSEGLKPKPAAKVPPIMVSHLQNSQISI